MTAEDKKKINTGETVEKKEEALTTPAEKSRS